MTLSRDERSALLAATPLFAGIDASGLERIGDRVADPLFVVETDLRSRPGDMIEKPIHANNKVTEIGSIGGVDSPRESMGFVSARPQPEHG